MRPLVSRGLLLPPLVCAALILGPVGTAAAVTDAGRAASDHGVSQTVGRYDTDDADTLVDRLDAVDRAEHGTVLQPLLDAVTDIAALNGTELDASEAAAHAKAVEAANTEVQEQLRQLSGSTERSAVAAADPVSDLLASIQATVDGLLKALTSLDLGGVLSAVTGLLGTVVGAVTGILGGLPVPALPALPAV